MKVRDGEPLPLGKCFSQQYLGFKCKFTVCMWASPSANKLVSQPAGLKINRRMTELLLAAKLSDTTHTLLSSPLLYYDTKFKICRDMDFSAACFIHAAHFVTLVIRLMHRNITHPPTHLNNFAFSHFDLAAQVNTHILWSLFTHLMSAA